MAEFRLQTERLILRSWQDGDVDDFLVVNADPAVMATLGPVMDRAAVAALIRRMQGIEAEHGHCFWALARRDTGRVIGWCGAIIGSAGPVAGKLEIGWRIARASWGAGYVSEAARAAVDWLFANRSADALWAITNTENHRSRAVMERLGMTYRADLDFDHPGLAADDPLLRHVTYELPRNDWPIAAQRLDAR